MKNKVIQQEIQKIKYENLEQMLYMAYYTGINYIKGFLKYGALNKITFKNKEIFHDYMQIMQEEKMLLNLLLKNSHRINEYAVLVLLDSLDEINEKTMKYYYQYLEDLEVAYELGEEHRTKAPIRNFKNLLETEQYREETIRILLGENVLQEYFNYSKEFWDYLAPRMTILDEDIDGGKSFFAVYIKTDTENAIYDLKVYVPYITNLETLLINIHEVNHAYMLYQNLNKPMQKEIDYEKIAKEEEQRFLESYFDEAYKRVFKKKNQFT